MMAECRPQTFNVGVHASDAPTGVAVRRQARQNRVPVDAEHARNNV